VALAVRHAEKQGCDLSELKLDELRQFSSLIGDDIYAVLTLEGSLAARNHTGGTAPAQVEAAIARARKLLAA
jgi:argininosuccinate lyase